MVWIWCLSSSQSGFFSSLGSVWRLGGGSLLSAVYGCFVLGPGFYRWPYLTPVGGGVYALDEHRGQVAGSALRHFAKDGYGLAGLSGWGFYGFLGFVSLVVVAGLGWVLGCRVLGLPCFWGSAVLFAFSGGYAALSLPGFGCCLPLVLAGFLKPAGVRVGLGLMGVGFVGLGGFLAVLLSIFVGACFIFGIMLFCLPSRGVLFVV
ncbi:hypothetical protein U1Q18_015679 [Sarracenia purpurea var. burkii]